MNKLRHIAALSLLSGSLLVGHAAPAHASGCTVSITFNNNSNDYRAVEFKKSEVKIQGGWFADLGKANNGNTWTGDLRPGDSVTRSFDLTFGCGSNRQYRFAVENLSHSPWDQFYPSSSTWTTSTSFTVNI